LQVGVKATPTVTLAGPELEFHILAPCGRKQKCQAHSGPWYWYPVERMIYDAFGPFSDTPCPRIAPRRKEK